MGRKISYVILYHIFHLTSHRTILAYVGVWYALGVLFEDEDDGMEDEEIVYSFMRESPFAVFSVVELSYSQQRLSLRLWEPFLYQTYRMCTAYFCIIIPCIITGPMTCVDLLFGLDADLFMDDTRLFSH